MKKRSPLLPGIAGEDGLEPWTATATLPVVEGHLHAGGAHTEEISAKNGGSERVTSGPLDPAVPDTSPAPDFQLLEPMNSLSLCHQVYFHFVSQATKENGHCFQ